MQKEKASSRGVKRRHLGGLVLVWLTILLLFGFLYVNARRSVINEIRHHAMGVAIAAASAISPDDLKQIRTSADAGKTSYRQIQSLLDRVEADNPDIRYIYTMRRSTRDNARESDFEFVVDSSPRDANHNGQIDESERWEPPGNPYDAASLPALQEAWYHPSADVDVLPDPPYPDLMSGYAPIKNQLGQTEAIVGVDITAATVRMKLFTLQLVILVVWLVLIVLITLVVQLYYNQRDALETNRALSSELAERNEMLRTANTELIRHNERFQRELKLAQSVQLGFLPKSFPRQDKIVFDKYYLTCEMLGGDMFDVFNVDQDHVGMYVADVAGHGVSAALISGLLKMAVSSVREHQSTTSGHLRANLTRPELILAFLNEMLIREIPDYEFITMVYVVLNIPYLVLSIASAGHPPPLHFNVATGRVEAWSIPTGPALGLSADSVYTASEKRVATGDKIICYTDGVVEAMNENNREFSLDQLIQVFQKNGHLAPTEVIASIKQSVEAHRGTREVTDDFSMLVAEIR